jgi:hypothetical protein
MLAERGPRGGGGLHGAHRGLHRPTECRRRAGDEEDAGGESSSSGQPYECGEKVFRAGLDAVEGRRSCGSVLYVLDGEARRRWRRRPEVSAVSKASVSESKRRGRGDARAPLDEGNGGGIGDTSLPLQPRTGGHPMAAHGAVARRGAAAAVNRGGGRVGVAWARMLLWAGPARKNSKER